MIGADTCVVKPSGRAMRAALEAAATTDGSSIAIGTSTSLPSMQKFAATANGSAYVPTTFSIMPSATSSGSALGSTAANAASGSAAAASSLRRRSARPRR